MSTPVSSVRNSPMKTLQDEAEHYTEKEGMKIPLLKDGKPTDSDEYLGDISRTEAIFTRMILTMNLPKKR